MVSDLREFTREKKERERDFRLYTVYTFYTIKVNFSVSTIGEQPRQNCGTSFTLSYSQSEQKHNLFVMNTLLKNVTLPLFSFFRFVFRFNFKHTT